MGMFSPVHILLIVVVIVLLFGPHKVPELMRGLGKGMGELQKGVEESKRMMTQAMNEVHDDPIPETHPYVAPIPDPPKMETPAHTVPVAEEPQSAVAVAEAPKSTEIPTKPKRTRHKKTPEA